MADWKFTDQYEGDYPSLANSILSLLEFSSHSVDGTAFTGEIDLAGGNVVVKTLATLTGVTTTIPVSGTVSDEGDTLTVSLTSTDGNTLLTGFASNIPYFGSALTGVLVSVETTAKKSETAEDTPTVDAFDLDLELQIGGATAALTAAVPIGDGVLTFGGTFEGVQVKLSDLDFLVAGSSSSSWFPSTALGPYDTNPATFALLEITVSGVLATQPSTKFSVSSVTLGVGISQFALLGQRVYLDPLGVSVAGKNLDATPEFDFGVEGEFKLLNYARQGTAHLDDPDFTLDFSLGFPSGDDKDFHVSASLGNPSTQSVNVMLQDLLGSGTDVGLDSGLTVTEAEFEAAADSSNGKVTDFSASVGMSGGFGLLEDFDIEEMSISVKYSD